MEHSASHIPGKAAFPAATPCEHGLADAGADELLWRERFKRMMSFFENSVPFADLNIICQQATVALCDILECDEAHLYLLNTIGDSFVMQTGKLRTGADAGYADDVDLPSFTFESGRMRHLADNLSPIVQDLRNPHPCDVPPDGQLERGIISTVSVPIATNAEVHGFFAASYRTPQNWSPDDLEFMLEIGRMLGALIKQARYVRNTIELETLLERKRLGEEIHDNLSQLLSLLVIRADAACTSLAEGYVDSLPHQLEKLSIISQEAFSVLREEILYLKTPIDDDFSLASRISLHLERFSEAWGLEVAFANKLPACRVLISAQAELQLTRILHEALVNTARHAHASLVSVSLSCNESKITLVVEDDGCGFDVDRVSSHSMGLRIMAERAISLYGELTVESKKGCGTTITATAPLLL